MIVELSVGNACWCYLSLFINLFFFFFNDTATTEIYTLSLHDALPISPSAGRPLPRRGPLALPGSWRDRKSTRLNSSHMSISYAVFCLKKKNNKLDFVIFLTKKKKKKNKITNNFKY